MAIEHNKFKIDRFTKTSSGSSKTTALSRQKKAAKVDTRTSKTLHALTSAAIVLPGLLLPSAAAAQATNGDYINFQFSRYEEGKRDLRGIPNNFDPIRADVLHGSGLFSLTDRASFTFSYTQDIWAGATPIVTSPLAANPYREYTEDDADGTVVAGASPIIEPLRFQNLPLDRDFVPLRQEGGQFIQDTRNVLVLSTASPETRNRANFGLGYEWDEAAINASAGFSLERDYESAFGNLGGRLDFNQKLTSVKFGAGYSSSRISAILDHDAAIYLGKSAYADQIDRPGDGSEVLRGDRRDVTFNLGVSQVLTKHALIDANFGYTHSSGYLAHPYKAVTTIFVDPEQLNDDSREVVLGDVRALLEQRPGQRNQWAFDTKYIQHISKLDAALHLNYRFSMDDWGIHTNTFAASWAQPLPGGWILTPRIRYYSQGAADFYEPFLITQQNFTNPVFDDQGREVWVDSNNPEIEYSRDENNNFLDNNGNIITDPLITANTQQKVTSFDSSKLPDDFSSDHRLAGFGALSGGVTLSKQFAKGVTLQAGFEYYTRASSFKLGGGGGNSFADFDYYVANASISLNLNTLRLPSLGGGSYDHAHHGEDGSAAHKHHRMQPAGVMFGHMLDNPGDFMVGYRFMYNRMDGDILRGTRAASDAVIVNEGCGDDLCAFAPDKMDMRMHMLNIMYAPTSWLNLMVMPHFMDMDMDLRELEGRPAATAEEHQHFGGHTTGVIGDTTVAALFKLYEHPGHRLHAGLGLSLPTGKTDLEFRRNHRVEGGAVHFGMQLGSGTFDLVPSLTYTGDYNRWSWGAQASGVKRLERRNDTGYRLGDIFQATTWTGYDLTPWLTATVRGAYTWQDRIHGDFNIFNARIGSMDFPSNYGGKFVNIGLGVNAVIPKGRFAGHHFGFEWLQPVHVDVNGFQLDRKGALAASWSYNF